jgi:hypothetical protein
MQVYVEDARFVAALCSAAQAHNRTNRPLPVHITVSTGAVRLTRLLQTKSKPSLLNRSGPWTGRAECHGCEQSWCECDLQCCDEPCMG